MRLTSLLVLLSLLVGCGPKKGPEGVAGPDDAKMMAFYDGGYTWCDAHYLGQWWQIDPSNAKVKAGGMVMQGEAKGLDAVLNDARTEGYKAGKACSWEATGLTFDDVVLLAAYWGVETWDAKGYIEEKVAMGLESELKWYVEDAMKMGMGHSDDPADQFFKSGYCYCDAKVLAAFWGEEDTYQAKVYIGEKLLSGAESTLNADLANARSAGDMAGLTCDLWETPFGYEDAETLATLWGLDIMDTKARISRKVFWGQSENVYEELKRARY